VDEHDIGIATAAGIERLAGALNGGRMWLNRPESCVDVVEETTMELSCAEAAAIPESRASAAKPITIQRDCMAIVLPVVALSIKPAVRH
jgi:hypothetical protein